MATTSGDDRPWWYGIMGVFICIVGQAAIAAAYLLKRWIAVRHAGFRRYALGSDGENDDDDDHIEDGTEYVQSCGATMRGALIQFARRLRDWRWWVAVVLLLGGETMNFVSYIFIPAFVVALLNGLNVILGVVGGVVLLKERGSWRIFLGTALAIGGMAVVLVLEALDTTATITRYTDLVAALQTPGALAFLVVASCVVASGTVCAMVLRTFPLEHRLHIVWLVLAAYAASASWSVLNTKAVGLMLTSPVPFNAYTLLVVPWWLAGVFGQLLLINWMFAERTVSQMAPLMYATYASVAIATSQLVFGELEGFTVAWHLALAAVAYVLVVVGVGLVASRKH